MCTYLGVPKLNGTRRQRIYVYYKNGTGEQRNNGYLKGRNWNDTRDSMILTISDPLMIAAETDETAKRPAALDLRDDNINATRAMADLVTFYRNNFGVKRPDNWDGTTKKKLPNASGGETEQDVLNVVGYKPHQYLIGLKANAQSANPTLYQTIGWTDRQGHGVWFDPLAE